MKSLSRINLQIKDTLLLALILAPFYFVNTIYFFHTHDEYYYIFTAIQLAEGEPLTVQIEHPLLTFLFFAPTTTPNIYISMYPIGQSLLIAVFYLIGGYPFIYYMNGFFSIFAVILTYLCAFEISKDRKCSILSAFLFGICPPIVFYSRTVLCDLPSTVFLLVSFLLYLKASNKNKYLFYVISSLSLGFATFLRYPNILFLLPILLNQIRTRKFNEISTYIYYIPLIPFFCMHGLYNAYFFGSFYKTGYHATGYVYNFSFENLVIHLSQYFLILNLFPPIGLIATFLFIRRKSREEAYFISFFMVVTFIIFYSSYSALAFRIENLLVQGARYLLVILPYLCINTVTWFHSRVKTKYLSYYIPVVVFLIFGLINVVMIAQFSAFKTRLVNYRDLFYTNTESDSLIIGTGTWDKLFYPLLNYDKRYYLRYDTLSEDEIIGEILPFVETWIQDKSVYFIDDPYEAYADRNKHNFILQLLSERYHLHSVIATDQPYTVELFKLS